MLSLLQLCADPPCLCLVKGGDPCFTDKLEALSSEMACPRSLSTRQNWWGEAWGPWRSWAQGGGCLLTQQGWEGEAAPSWCPAALTLVPAHSAVCHTQTASGRRSVRYPVAF